MAHVAHDPRLVKVPEEHREYAATLLRELGPRAAAKHLGLGRGALLGILATGECMPGTAALMREAFGRKAA
jgi:hypothetical protein